MRFHAHLAISAVLLLSPNVFYGQTASTAAVASQAGSLQIAQKTEAPGLSLSPGSYVVRIADHLNDRIIVQVQRKAPSWQLCWLTPPAVFRRALAADPSFSMRA